MHKEKRAPSHLNTHGRRLWREIVTGYELDDPAGLALLTTACECLDRMRAAQQAIAEHGEMVLDRYQQLKTNPACVLERDARNGFLAAIRALNLDILPAGKPGRPAGLY